MFLSRVEIPWEAACNPYELYRRLWRLFPGEPKESRNGADEARQGFLFRLENNPPGHPARLLMQSRMAPQFVPGLSLLGTREFHPQPSTGQRLAFLLTANPIKTIVDEERGAKPDKRSEKCRVPLIREEEQRAWLTRKLKEVAEVEAVSLLPHAPVYFRKGNRGGKLVTASFEGALKVANPTALVACLENGIGPAKAFGWACCWCGGWGRLSPRRMLMDWRDRIETDPAICGGRPRIKGTRLTVEFLLGLKASGWTEATILENYPHITQDDLRAVFAFVQSLIEEQSFLALPRAA